MTRWILSSLSRSVSVVGEPMRNSPGGQTTNVSRSLPTASTSHDRPPDRVIGQGCAVDAAVSCPRPQVRSSQPEAPCIAGLGSWEYQSSKRAFRCDRSDGANSSGRNSPNASRIAKRSRTFDAESRAVTSSAGCRPRSGLVNELGQSFGVTGVLERSQGRMQIPHLNQCDRGPALAAFQHTTAPIRSGRRQVLSRQSLP